MVRACEDGLSFGAPTEIEVEMAEFICQNIPHVEMIRMVNSGTEAVMSAIRAARGFTGRNKIVKFSGCYHGHSDCLLVDARLRPDDRRDPRQRRSSRGMHPGHPDGRI